MLKKDLALTPKLREKFPGIINIIGHISSVQGKPELRQLSFEPSPKSVSKFRRSPTSTAMEVPYVIQYASDKLPLPDIIRAIKGEKEWPKNKYTTASTSASNSATNKARQDKEKETQNASDSMSEAEDLKVVEKGIYGAVLDEWEYVEKPPESGNPYLKLVFAINDGGPFDGRKLTRNFSAMPQSLGFMKRALIALGVEPETVNEDFDTDELLPDLVGNSCRISVSVRKYEGEDQNDIRRVMAEE